MTIANEFDKINELLIERTAKKLKKLQKKFLTNEKLCGKINELIRVGAAKILDN